MQIAACLTCATCACGENKLGGGKCFACLEFVIGGIRVDGWNDTQTTHIVYLEGKTEVACPPDGSEHHISLMFFSGLVKSEFKERFSVHGCTRAKFGVNNLLSCS